MTSRRARRNLMLRHLRDAEARVHRLRAWWGYDERVTAQRLAAARLAVVAARDALARTEVRR